MEKLDISQRGAQAKIVGTVVAFAGATLMTLYKGIVVVSLLHSQQSHQTSTSKASLDKNWLKGSFMLVISNISYSAFYILQDPKSIEAFDLIRTKDPEPEQTPVIPIATVLEAEQVSDPMVTKEFTEAATSLG
nr:isoform 2 of wat1-related protein [Quercus suber]